MSRLPVLRRREAGAALEVTAEGGLVVEAQQVGHSLHREVVPDVQQHLGFHNHLVLNPVGGSVTRLLLDDGAEVLGRETGPRGVEAHVAVFAEVLHEVAVEAGADTHVAAPLVEFALAVVAQQAQQELQQTRHQLEPVWEVEALDLAHAFHHMRDDLVLALVELHVGVRLVAMAHLADDLQHRVVHQRCVDDYQGGQVVVRDAHLAQGVAWEDDAYGVLLAVVDDVVIHEVHAAAMANGYDIVGRGEGLVARRQPPDVVKHNDAFLPDSLRVKVHRVGIVGHCYHDAKIRIFFKQQPFCQTKSSHPSPTEAGTGTPERLSPQPVYHMFIRHFNDTSTILQRYFDDRYRYTIVEVSLIYR